MIARSARRLRGLHGLGRGGAGRATRRRGRFIRHGLELGGKDPAYVRARRRPRPRIENIVDGAYFNSGQSCCGIERIYVHSVVYDRFVEGFVELTRKLRARQPARCRHDPRADGAHGGGGFVRGQIGEAVRRAPAR